MTETEMAAIEAGVPEERLVKTYEHLEVGGVATLYGRPVKINAIDLNSGIYVEFIEDFIDGRPKTLQVLDHRELVVTDAQKALFGRS